MTMRDAAAAVALAAAAGRAQVELLRADHGNDSTTYSGEASSSYYSRTTVSDDGDGSYGSSSASSPYSASTLASDGTTSGQEDRKTASFQSDRAAVEQWTMRHGGAWRRGSRRRRGKRDKEERESSSSESSSSSSAVNRKKSPGVFLRKLLSVQTQVAGEATSPGSTEKNPSSASASSASSASASEQSSTDEQTDTVGETTVEEIETHEKDGTSTVAFEVSTWPDAGSIMRSLGSKLGFDDAPWPTNDDENKNPNSSGGYLYHATKTEERKQSSANNEGIQKPNDDDNNNRATTTNEQPPLSILVSPSSDNYDAANHNHNNAQQDQAAAVEPPMVSSRTLSDGLRLVSTPEKITISREDSIAASLKEELDGTVAVLFGSNNGQKTNQSQSPPSSPVPATPDSSPGGSVLDNEDPSALPVPSSVPRSPKDQRGHQKRRKKPRRDHVIVSVLSKFDKEPSHGFCNSSGVGGFGCSSSGGGNGSRSSKWYDCGTGGFGACGDDDEDDAFGTPLFEADFDVLENLGNNGDDKHDDNIIKQQRQPVKVSSILEPSLSPPSPTSVADKKGEGDNNDNDTVDALKKDVKDLQGHLSSMTYDVKLLSSIVAAQNKLKEEEEKVAATAAAAAAAVANKATAKESPTINSRGSSIGLRSLVDDIIDEDEQTLFSVEVPLNGDISNLSKEEQAAFAAATTPPRKTKRVSIVEPERTPTKRTQSRKNLRKCTRSEFSSKNTAENGSQFRVTVNDGVQERQTEKPKDKADAQRSKKSSSSSLFSRWSSRKGATVKGKKPSSKEMSRQKLSVTVARSAEQVAVVKGGKAVEPKAASSKKSRFGWSRKEKSKETKKASTTNRSTKTAAFEEKVSKKRTAPPEPKRPVTQAASSDKKKNRGKTKSSARNQTWFKPTKAADDSEEVELSVYSNSYYDDTATLDDTTTRLTEGASLLDVSGYESDTFYSKQDYSSEFSDEDDDDDSTEYEETTIDEEDEEEEKEERSPKPLQTKKKSFAFFSFRRTKAPPSNARQQDVDTAADDMQEHVDSESKDDDALAMAAASAVKLIDSAADYAFPAEDDKRVTSSKKLMSPRRTKKKKNPDNDDDGVKAKSSNKKESKRVMSVKNKKAKSQPAHNTKQTTSEKGGGDDDELYRGERISRVFGDCGMLLTEICSFREVTCMCQDIADGAKEETLVALTRVDHAIKESIRGFSDGCNGTLTGEKPSEKKRRKKRERQTR